MRLKSVTAKPHPQGYRIDVAWVNPNPAAFPGVRLVRRTGTHPAAPDDGVVVAEGMNLPFTLVPEGRAYTIPDTGLRGDTVYYYTLFPYTQNPPDYRLDPENRTSAPASASYAMGQRMYGMLPAIYHRYDAALPAGVTPAFLRTFLELPGGELDLLHSLARGILDLPDVDRVDGRLLPYLAQWIGWDTNHRLEVATQRNELRSAPYLYRTIGIVPTVEATIKRVLGWESSAKEFVHNVARSNAPERLNPWTLRRGPGGGAWAEMDAPLSVDFDHEGRPAAATDGDGVLWLFFSTLRNSRWDLWCKTLRTFAVDIALQPDLEGGTATPDVRQAFAAEGFPLPPEVEVRTVGGQWELAAPDGSDRFVVRAEDGALAVFHWAPSERLTNDLAVDKHPAALAYGGALHLFWDSYDPATGRWRILRRTRSGGAWSAPATFGDPETDRRGPALVADDTGGVWVFWMEKRAGGWELRYIRGDGDSWESEPSHAFPADGGASPRVHGDLFAHFQPASGGDPVPRLWLFWSRKAKAPDGTTRWQIAYRAATGLDPSAVTVLHAWSPDFPDHLSVDTGALPVDLSVRTYYVNRPLEWSPVFVLPGSGTDFGAREPAAAAMEGGGVELFYASDRDGGWGVWRRALTAADPPAWSPAVRLTSGPWTQSGPLPCPVAGGTLLLYRSNQSVRYGSRVYRATGTVDARHAGSTTADARNLAKNALRESYDDFATYVYDAGEKGVRTDRDWYARDTVGIYLDAPTDDQGLIVRNRNLITKVLRQFLPAPVRVVFIIPIVTREAVYTYDLPDADPQRLLGEEVADTLDVPAAEAYGGMGSEYADTMAGWARAYAWSQARPDAATVDTGEVPPDLSRRSWHTGVQTGE